MLPLVRPLLLTALTFCALVVASALPAAAQSFTPGDLYLASRSLPTVGEAIVRIDPVTGADTLLVDLPDLEPLRGTLTWDPSRDRLLASVTAAGGVGGLIAVDAAGSVSSLVPTLATPERIAARGDGIVYLFYGFNQTIRYVDGSNMAHDLLDVPGTGSYALNAIAEEMIYDPGTNSLLLFQAGLQFTVCPVSTEMCAIKIPLTPDGTQVAGAVSLAQQEVSTSGEVPVGSGYLPGGDILIVLDTNSNDAEPRMLALEPATMALSTFATNGPYTGAAATNAGTYSNTRGEALILDTLVNALRAYSLGESGAGTTLGSGLSSASGSGEIARLVEIGATTSAVPSLPPLGFVLLIGSLATVGLFAGHSRIRGLRSESSRR